MREVEESRPMTVPSEAEVEQRLAEVRAFIDALTIFERNEVRDQLAALKELDTPLSERGEELKSALLKLPWYEQKAIAEFIQRLHSRPPGVLSSDHPRFEEILAERICKADAGETKWVTWEEVQARLDAKFGRPDRPNVVADTREEDRHE